MQELMKKYSIELEENESKLFEKFLKIFIEKNSQINLSAIRDETWIIEKHFIDSIILNAFVELKPHPNPLLKGEGETSKVKVADMGTGWWFPWIPLAITNTNANFTLIDSVWKKLKAIDSFIEELDLNNIKTLNWRAEEIWQDIKYREQFDFVVSRATAYFPTLLEYTIPLLKVWWIFAAYKLDDKEELKTWKKALTRLGAKILKVKNYTIWDQKRTIVFVEKISKTHIKYPRKNGVPLANPIK